MPAADALRAYSSAGAAAAWVGWAAAAQAAVTATAGFPVTVTLRPPPGCVVTTSSAGGSATPQITLTCGSNLFVSVQPTILTPPTSASGTSTLPVTTLASTGTSGSLQPPAELTQSIASLMNLSDTSASAGSALFVQRSTAAATTTTSAALAPSRTSAPQPAAGGPAGPSQDNASDSSAQTVEVWLFF